MRCCVAAAVGLLLLLGGCGSYQRVELVNSTPETVSVSVATARGGWDAEPRADVAPGGRFRYVASGGKMASGEVRVTPRTPGLMEARLAVGGGTFRGWIRRSGAALVIEPAGADLPPW
jgi:hypothetical protein